MYDLVLSIVTLAAIALMGGAIYLWRKGGHAKQAMLMAILAFIMIANVAIWVGPEPVPEPESGDAVVDPAPPVPLDD